MSRSVTIDLIVTVGGGQQLAVTPVTTSHRTRDVLVSIAEAITITIKPVV